MLFGNCIYAFVVKHKIYYYLQCFNDFYLFEKFALVFLRLYVMMIFGNFVMLIIMAGILGIYALMIETILNQRINDNY